MPFLLLRVVVSVHRFNSGSLCIRYVSCYTFYTPRYFNSVNFAAPKPLFCTGMLKTLLDCIRSKKLCVGIFLGANFYVLLLA